MNKPLQVSDEAQAIFELVDNYKANYVKFESSLRGAKCIKNICLLNEVMQLVMDVRIHWSSFKRDQSKYKRDETLYCVESLLNAGKESHGFLFALNKDNAIKITNLV